MSDVELEAAPGGAGDGPGQSLVTTRHRDHQFPARGRRITVRLDDGEHAAIVLAAGRAGLTPTGYVGAVALAAATGAVGPAPSETREVLAELVAARVQVRRFGGNVNQAVAALNATGEAPVWLGEAWSWPAGRSGGSTTPPRR